MTLLEKLPASSEVGYPRDALAHLLGYSSGKSGIAGRKIAALVHFGFFNLRGGLYSPTQLLHRLRNAKTEEQRSIALKEACQNPLLFREIFSTHGSTGRVPFQLAEHLATNHGIQRQVSFDVARIFMESARLAGILENDGRIRPDETTRTPHRSPAEAQQELISAATAPAHEAEFETAEPDGLLPHKFRLTENKPAEIWLPSRVNEQDIEVLRAYVDFLARQVSLNQPDHPIQLDVIRGRRKK